MLGEELGVDHGQDLDPLATLSQLTGHKEQERDVGIESLTSEAAQRPRGEPDLGGNTQIFE